MVRAGEKGVALCAAVKQERAKRYIAEGLFREKPFCLLEAESIQVEHKPCADDRAAGKAAAGTKMAV